MKSELQNKFIRAYEEHADPIFRFCYFRVNDREKAKELMQESFMRLWDSLKERKKIDNLKSFTYRIATNLVIDHWRRKKELSLDKMMEQGFDAEDNELDPAVKAEADRLLRMAGSLQEPYRAVLIMRFVDGLGPKEIAEITNESENIVSVRLHRAVAQLKKLSE